MVNSDDDIKQVRVQKGSKYKITVRKDLCIGAATCSAIAPNTFLMNDDNIAEIVEGKWDEDEIILAAAESCPVLAIIIEDVETGKQIFPILDEE